MNSRKSRLLLTFYRVQIDAIKFERTQIHFLSNVFTAVVVVVTWGPYLLLKKNWNHHPPWIRHFELIKCIPFYLRPVWIEVILIEKFNLCIKGSLEAKKIYKIWDSESWLLLKIESSICPLVILYSLLYFSNLSLKSLHYINNYS